MNRTGENPSAGKVDTMNAVETCAICGGSGWKITEREGISGAEKCQCADVGREQRIEERAGIPPLYQNASHENFKNLDRPELAAANNHVRVYIRQYPVLPKPGLLFLGPPGSGKTHLAVAALRGLIARGFEGIFCDFQTLLTRIHKGYDKASGASDREAFQSALDAEILLLDDVGASRINDWVEDTVTSIVTHRCNSRKATIVTSNLRDQDAGDKRSSGLQEDLHSKYFLDERIGMRARSRLFEMCKLIQMRDVEDYRLKRK
jgi:DNA replication protein DnaC